MRRHPDSGHFFTLTELLVVMAVIAILSALLLPALGKAKEHGRTIACVNNLKSCGVSLACYADDYDGVVVLKSGDGVMSCITYKMVKSLNYMTRQAAACPDVPMSTTAWGSDNYYAVPYCQAAWAWPGMETESLVWPWLNVGLSTVFAVKRVGKPTALMIFSDVTSDGKSGGYTYAGDTAAASRLHFRHAKRLPANWLDGHVSTLSLGEARGVWLNWHSYVAIADITVNL